MAWYSSSATLMVKGTRMRYCRLLSIPVGISILFTYMMSMQYIISWRCLIIYGGTYTKSFFKGVDLFQVVLPFSAPMLAP